MGVAYYRLLRHWVWARTYSIAGVNQQESPTGLTKGKEKTDSSLTIENERLRHQVRQLEQEREILKKALAIFSRQTSG